MRQVSKRHFVSWIFLHFTELLRYPTMQEKGPKQRKKYLHFEKMFINLLKNSAWFLELLENGASPGLPEMAWNARL